MIATSAREMAAALGGRALNHMSVIAPGPGHSPKDRSMKVTLIADAPEGFLVHSFAGDDDMECRAYVRQKLGMQEWRASHIGVQHQVVRGAPGPDDEEIKRIELANECFGEGYDWHDTLIESYLASRSLKLDSSITTRTIRFHPRCPWREASGELLHIPVLMAAFRSIDTDELTGIQRIRLDRRDLWPKPGPPGEGRKMLGVTKRAAIKLDAMTSELVIVEGVETGLAARKLGHMPVWALGSVGAISRFPVIEKVRLLRIAVENGSESIKASGQVHVRWKAAKKLVRIIWPQDGCSDLNDQLIRDNIA